MKFTINWLKDHLETNASLQEIDTALTAVGLEVEEIENPAEAYKDFTVAHVESAEKHPDADRLKVCMVNTGKETLQIVCGAPNARAGIKVIFAPVGSYIPGLDITLKKGNIRGQDSFGMMVSEKEMCLSDEHKGIIEAPEDAAIGTPFSELAGLDDPVIEIALTPNRADCAGVRGIARDLAAADLGTLKPLDETAIKGAFASPINVKLAFDKDSADACPLFIGRTIKNVKNGPSPDWLQQRLKAIGLRPISALVDITNYVSYNLCRPLHVFDADKLEGDITVRLARKGEELAALDEKTHKLADFMTVVADDKNVLALGGVMGGENSGCTAETTTVFLEVAYFDPHRTAKTGRALQIPSDARYRFERGVDPEFTVPATEIATRLIIELCGGEASENVISGAVPAWERTINYDPSYLKQLAGYDIDVKTQETILSTLGFEIDSTRADDWQIKPPSWRSDVEGRADIVEEVLRIVGYDNIPAVSMVKDSAVTEAAETDAIALARQARHALASRGLNESITWSFMNRDLAESFGCNDNDNADSMRLQNPISSELDQMRPSILPNLIEAAGRNSDKGVPNAAIFEVGPVFQSVKNNGELIVATGLRSGAQGSRHWASAEESRAIDVFDAKADAIAVLEACGGPAANLQITRDAPDYYHPGRSGALRLGKNVLAYFGEIHPAILDEMDVKATISGFEVFLDSIPTKKNKKGGAARKLLKLSPLQPLARDFAFIVEGTVDADNIIRAAKGADKNMIADVELFDVYQGKGVEDGKKSIAINVIIQPAEQTLTDEDIEALSKKIIENVTHKTGGVLRG